ncbi:hypothetical protein D3C75_1139390 [compost metagenome]
MVSFSPEAAADAAGEPPAAALGAGEEALSLPPEQAARGARDKTAANMREIDFPFVIIPCFLL